MGSIIYDALQIDEQGEKLYILVNSATEMPYFMGTKEETLVQLRIEAIDRALEQFDNDVRTRWGRVEFNGRSDTLGRTMTISDSQVNIAGLGTVEQKDLHLVMRRVLDVQTPEPEFHDLITFYQDED